MANKQYLIEIAVKNDKLKSSLKKSLEDPAVQKQLGILGEGITEHLEKDIGKATSILGKVDWASLLGEKDFEHLQQLVAKTVSANKDLIKSFVKSNDTQGIQDAIDLVSALGSELKAISPDKTVAGLARSMASFMKTIEPIAGKFEALANEPQKLAAALGSMANNTGLSEVDKQIRETFKTAQNMINALNSKAALGALEASLKDVYGEAIKLQDVMFDSDKIDAYLAKFTTAKEITEEMTRLMNDHSRNTTRNPVDRIILKQHLEALQGKLTPMMPTLDSSAIKDEVKTVSKDIDATLEQVVDKLGDSFNKKIEEKLGHIRVTVDVPTEDALIADLNTVIEKVNKKGGNSLKLVGAESAINTAQNQILENTKKWNEKMKEYLKFDKKEDIQLDLGAKMREMGSNVGEDFKRSINEYFDDPNNRVSIPVELILTDENKAVLQGGNITINGGNVSGGGGGITAESLAEALTTPIEVKVQEEQSKQKPDGKLISIEREGQFAQEVVDVFEELFKAVGREGKNAKDIDWFFNLKDVNLKELDKLVGAERNNAIIHAFETLLERGDQSLLDQVQSLAKGSTKNVATTSFRNLVEESVLRFNLRQIGEEEDVKRRHVRNLVEEDYIPRSTAQEALFKIRNTSAEDYRIPTVEDFDQLMQTMPQVWGKLGEDFLPGLESLKQLRSTITDPKNTKEIERFKNAADEFVLNTDSFYKEMGDFMRGYKIGIFNKGHNKNEPYYDYAVNGGVRSGNKLLANWDKIDYFELYDDPSGHFSRGNRKDAMDNASSLDRYQLRRDSRNASYRTREPQRTYIPAEDIEIKIFEPKEQPNEQLQDINQAKNDAEKRVKAIEEVRKTSIEEEKKAEELRKQQLAADKKRRTALKSQRTKNENKINNTTDKSVAQELKLKNEQLEKEIKELDANISKNSVEPTKTPTVKQQLDVLPKASEVQSMIDEVNAIDTKIDDTKKQIDELDEWVNKNFKAEKKPNTDYTKSENNNINKNETLQTRLVALSQVLNEKDRTQLDSLSGLTEKDLNAIFKLLSDRQLYQLINGDRGLGLPKNSQLENIAKYNLQEYQKGLNQIDDFILKHNISIGTTKNNTDLTEFMKDSNVQKVLSGTFKGSQENEAEIRTKINEFKTRMIEAGKSYVADYIDMWSDKNLRELMQKDGIDTRNATDAKGTSILQEFYRILTSGGEGDFSKRDEAYQYLRSESAKYKKNIQKDETSLEKTAVSVWEKSSVTETKNQAATERVKEKYKEYVNRWLYTIQENMYEVLFGELDDKDAGAKLKKNDELRRLVDSIASKYFKNFGEELLTGDQKEIIEKTYGAYTNFKDQKTSTLIDERTQKQAATDEIITQKADLLRQRRFDLLNKISDNTSKGKDTTSLEKALSEVENELIMYSDELPHLLKNEFEADLLNAKNATEEEWKNFAANVAQRQNEYDTTKYTELKGKQKTLLSDIEAKTKKGESTRALEGELEAINKELVQYEVSVSRMEDIKKSIFPDNASARALHVYNTEMEELVKLLQEKAYLEAKGEKTIEIDRKITKQKSRVIDQTRRQIEEEKRVAAEYDPKNQAAKFIAETDKDEYILQQRENEARRKLDTAHSRLATMQGDKYYNSSLYKNRIESLKDQDISDYVRSDEYKNARDKGMKQANEEFGAYIAEQLGEDVAQRVVYEFSKNKDRADIDAVMDGAGNTPRLVGNAFSEAVAEARKNYIDGEEYKTELAKKKEEREAKVNDILKEDKTQLDTKIQEIWNKTQEDIRVLRQANMANSQELRDAVYAEAEKVGMGDSSEYRRSIVDQVREGLIQQRIDVGRQEQKFYNQQYYAKAREVRSQLSPDMYQGLNEKADQAAYNIVMAKIQELTDNNKDLLKGLDEKRNEFIEANIGNLIQQRRDSLSMEETGLYVPMGTNQPINIREQLEKELMHEVAFYEQKYIEASGKLGALQHQRNKAMSFGELGTVEVDNPEIARIRAEAEARLSAEKERQVNLTEKLTNLTAQNADRQVVQSVGAELSATEKEIERLKLLIEGASSALSLRQQAKDEEEAARIFTPEQQRLWYIDKIEQQKGLLESGTNKQKENAPNIIAKLEQKLADVEKRIEESKPEVEKPKTVLDMITHAIRDGLAGVTAGGTVDLDASLYNIATETTLQEILRLLGGNGAVEYANQLKTELERYKPHYEKRNYESGGTSGGRSGGKKGKGNKELDKLNTDGQRIYGELDAQAKIFTDSLKKGSKQYAPDFDFVKAIKEQTAVVKKQTKGSLEYIQEQTKLTVLYQDYYQKTYGKGRKKKGQPSQSAWATQGELGKIDDLKDLLLFKYKRADALVGLNYGAEGVVATEETSAKTGKKKSSKKKNTKTSTSTTEEVVVTDNNELQQVITNAIKESNDGSNQLDKDALMTKVLGTVMQTVGIDPNDKDVAKIISSVIGDGGLGRDTDVKSEVTEGVKQGISESSKDTISEDKLPYDIAPDSLIGKLQNTVGGDTGALAKQATLALVLSELQNISKKIPTIGKSGVKSSAQNLLEEFQKMAMGSAMDGKERVAYLDLVNGAMSPALSGSPASVSQKLLDTLSQDFGVDKGYRSQIHTHADSDQTWFSKKDLDHFKKNISDDFGVNDIKQQILLTKDSITVFDMTMVETAENARKAIDILRQAGSDINNETLEKLAGFGAKYHSKSLDIGAKSLMDLLGVKNYKNDGKKKGAVADPEVALKGLESYAKSDADKRNSKYVFNSFDGETLKYQLIDVEGHISKVVLAWDELEKKVRVVSDTSTSSMDATVQKIQQYRAEIEKAQSEKLLSDGDDANFIAAEQEADKILKQIETGDLSGQKLSEAINSLDAARQKLAEEGAKLHKLIVKNDKLRGGTNEVKSAITQGVKIRSALGDSIDTDELDEMQLFKVSDDAPEYLNRYISEYNALVKIQQQYINDGQINNPKIQDALKVQAEGVKKLGREAMTAYQNTQRLQEQSDIWEQQTYTDKNGNAHALGGSKYVGTQGVDRTAMLQYAKEVLGADLASVKLNTTTGELSGVLRKNNYVVADMTVKYDEATGKMHLFQVKERESLGGLPGFMNALKEKSKAITQYIVSMTSIYRVFGELKKGVQYVREIDSALTELKKVTDKTEETYDRFLNTAAKTADKVGSTIQEIVSSTADWARLGYSMEEAAGLAESTSVLLNVSEFQSIEDATGALTSTLQAFSYTADESMHVVDVLNEVGNNFAISSDGIATALQDSASSLMAANNSYEEAVALIASANRVVQDPNSVGAALRTISLRLRGTSVEELEEAGEDTAGVVTSKSKLRGKVKSLSGVDILTDTGAYKSTYDVLLEISKVWEDMSDIDQAALLEIIAGKTRSNTAAAILSNTKDLEEAYVQALEAEGSALKENEKYLDSIQGRINVFNNAVQTMWSNALDSEVIKGVVSLGTVLIKIIDKIGLLQSLFIALSAYSMIKSKTGPIAFLNGISEGFDGVVKRAKDYIGSLASMSTTTSVYTAETLAASVANGTLSASEAASIATKNGLKLATTSLTAAEATELLTKGGMTQAEALNLVSKLNLTKGTKELTAATLEATMAQQGYTASQIESAKTAMFGGINPKSLTNLKQAFANLPNWVALGKAGNGIAGMFAGLGKGLSGIWAAIPTVGQIMLIVGAVTAVLKIIDALTTTTEEYAEKLENLKSELESIQSELDSLNTELETTQDRMAELLAMDSLSFTEQEELKNLQKQNDELERQIYLLEQRQKRKQKESEETFNNIMFEKLDVRKTEFANISGRESNESALQAYKILKDEVFQAEQELITLEKKYSSATTEEEKKKIEKDIKKAEKELEKKKKESNVYETSISNAIEQYSEYADGIDYELADDETKKYLDYIGGFEDSFNILQGDNQAKTFAIKRILNKEDLEDEVEAIDKYVKALKNGDTSAEDSIKNFINNSDDFKEAVNEVKGLELQDIIDYFTLESSGFNSDTLGGILNQFAQGEEILRKSNQYQKQIEAEMTELQKGGSVDLLNRKQIKTADMMKTFYSQDKYAEELTKELEGVTDQDLSTVWTQTFSNKDFGLSGPEIAMNFTPILPDGTVMEKDKFESYVEGVLKGAEDTEGLKIGVTFDGENAIEEAAKTAEHIHILQQDYYNELQLGVDKSGEAIMWGDLFKEVDGEKVVDDLKVAEVLEGVDTEISNQFANIIEEVENGKIGVDEAMAKWELAGINEMTRVLNAEFESLNNELFPDAKDEISGLIDTLDELKAAFESVASTMDTFKSAQEEMNATGRVSIKTALELMSSTDDWDSILNITEDSITLVAGSEKELMEIQLKQIAEQTQKAADLAAYELRVAKEAQAAAEAFEAETKAANDLNSAEQGVMETQDDANVVTNARTGQMGQLQNQTNQTGQSEIDYANNDGPVMSAEGAKAKAIGLVSAMIIGLDAALTAFNEGSFFGRWGDAAAAFNSAYSQAKVEVSGAYDIAALEKKAYQTQQMANLANQVDTYEEFSKNYGDDDSGSDDKDDAFQKAMDYWENRIAANQAKYEQIQNEIDLAEKQGKIAGKEYYEEQVKLENQRLKLLEAQKAEAKKFLGTFKEGSEEWWEVASTLNDIEGEIDDVTASLQDLSDAIAEVDWKIFEETHERYGNLIDDLNTIRDLVSPNGEEDWFDDDGMWTDKGVASLATYMQQLQMYENALAETNKKIKKYNKEYAGNEKYYKKLGIDSEQELYDKREELIDQQYEYRTAISDTQNSVADMYEAQIDAVEEYTNKLIDSYNEYIDVVKEALDAERDLYEFKKSIEEDTKNISELERKIASLSGSTDAGDIAEMRKLQAELNDAKSDLDDKYYSHAKDAQANALSDEAEAYEESMNKFVEGLRTALDTALLDMEGFMASVYNSVIMNSPAIKEQYESLGLSLDDAIIDPWTEAAEAIKKYGGVDGLGIMNTWIAEGGVFPTFKTSATDALKSPWDAGKTALNNFKTSVKTEMKNIVDNIKSNVVEAEKHLKNLYNRIEDTGKKSLTVGNTGNTGNTNSPTEPKNSGYKTGSDVKALQKILNKFFEANISVDGVYGPATTTAVKKAQDIIKNYLGNRGYRDLPQVNGKYDAKTKQTMQTYFNLQPVGSWFKDNKISIPPAIYHAKGTLGTKKDEWAITDESWIGEEITLAAGKNGQLQYLKKGSAVMPADISANLVEWGKLDPGSLSLPTMGDVNVVSNAILQPNFEMNFDSLVHVDHCDEGTLKSLEKMMDTKINDFGKQLNYSIKKFAR